MQELAYRLNPENVIAGTHREYGHANLKARSVGDHVDRLFDGIEDSMRVWMSHGDKLAKLPEGFHTIATSDNSEYAAIGHESKPIYGLQFHPEVTHTQNGTELLKNFAVGICGCKQDWTMQKFLEEAIAQIRHSVGEKGQVLAAVSGGVDSTVAAALMVTSHAISPPPFPPAQRELKLTVCGRKKQLGPGSGPSWWTVRNLMHVSNISAQTQADGVESDGVMRLDECQQVRRDLSEALGINLTVVDAAQRFLDGLKGVEDPEVHPPSFSCRCVTFLTKTSSCRKSASSSVCPGSGSWGCPLPAPLPAEAKIGSHLKLTAEQAASSSTSSKKRRSRYARTGPAPRTSSPTTRVVDRRQIEEAAAHDASTGGGKIEFFMQYV